MIEFCLLDLVIVIVAKIFCILFHLPFPYCAKKNPGGGGGYFWEVWVWVNRPVLQILTDDPVSGIESRARVPLWQALKFIPVSFKLCKIVQGQKKVIQTSLFTFVTVIFGITCFFFEIVT